MRALEDARTTDPQADVLRKATLNRLVQRLRFARRGLETPGERQQAKDVPREALEVLPGSSCRTNSGNNQQWGILQARLARLQ
jgi:hypothetical protein